LPDNAESVAKTATISSQPLIHGLVGVPYEVSLMKRVPVIGVLALAALALSIACATKKEVTRETAPVINKVNELDDLTAQTTRDTRSLDARAQQGIQDAKTKAGEADQHALAAGQQADQAQQLASSALNGTNALAERVTNFDNYKPVTEVAVHFAFDKAELTRQDKQQLDELAQRIPDTKGYIVQIEGNTDSVGNPEYNYELSQRRASAVTQYLAHKYNVPPHKIYVIGLGKDRPEAKNTTAQGRAENRRVDVRLMSNIASEEHPSTPMATR
jgi:outer membrane protein OmpA-like peptidoglycan-associated protein